MFGLLSKRLSLALALVLSLALPAQAAISITKINTNTLQTGASTTLAYSGAVAAGSTLIGGGFDYSGGAPASPAISDTVNGAWTVKRYATLTADGNVEIWAATFENTAAGTPTVTWDPGGSADMGGWFIAEITGATTPTSVDVVPAASQQANTNTPSIASGTLSQANEIIIAITSGQTNDSAPAITGDGTYTQLVNQPDNLTSQMGQAQYKITSSTTTDTADWSVADTAINNRNKVSILLSVKEGGGVPPPTCTPTLSLLGVGRPGCG